MILGTPTTKRSLWSTEGSALVKRTDEDTLLVHQPGYSLLPIGQAAEW